MERGEGSKARGGGYGMNPGGKDPFCLGDSSDPRLGLAQKHKVSLYAQLKLGNPDDDNPDDFEEEDDDLSDQETSSTVAATYVDSTDAYDLSDSEIEQEKFNYDYTWRRNLNLAVKNELKHLREFDSLCAKLAIDFYNRINATEYRVVQTLGSFSMMSCGIWSHCNFRAAVAVRGRGPSLPPKTFFAELRRVTQTNVVKACYIIDGLNPSLGCKMCGDKLLHPTNKFEAGK